MHTNKMNGELRKLKGRGPMKHPIKGAILLTGMAFLMTGAHSTEPAFQGLSQLMKGTPIDKAVIVAAAGLVSLIVGAVLCDRRPY